MVDVDAGRITFRLQDCGPSLDVYLFHRYSFIVDVRSFVQGRRRIGCSVSASTRFRLPESVYSSDFSQVRVTFRILNFAVSSCMKEEIDSWSGRCIL